MNDNEPEPDAPARTAYTASPKGIRRADESELEIIDALAGRSSVFGFGDPGIIKAIQMVADQYLGGGPAGDSMDLIGSLRSIGIDDSLSHSAGIASSPDAAVEQVLMLARRRDGGRRYRTIAMVGSDHGRTAMCRTASGKPELHEGLGPMMAGFAHVPPGDLKAVESQIDDQTGCVLLCPIDFQDSGRAATQDYLFGLRELCNKHDLLLAIDETPLVFGATGNPLTCQSIAEIEPNLVALSSGLFGGLSGGLWMADQRVTEHPEITIDAAAMLAVLAKQTLATLIDEDVLSKVSSDANEFAVAIAETIANYEFVRDVHASGWTIAIETDIESTELVRIAGRIGLHVDAAGDLAIRLQPPLAMNDDDREVLLDAIGRTFTAAEAMTAEMTV